MEIGFMAIENKKDNLFMTYLDRRPILKNHLIFSDKIFCAMNYPKFAIIGYNFDDSDDPDMLNALFNDLVNRHEAGLHLLYGSEFDEFAMLNDLNYYLYGTEFLEKRIYGRIL